ncbi:AhpC-TSA-domain-containing protein [Mytilinidion resinicola]|uniref:thioredoxin-dependent peroxiredoxin n=1 Tax=Mytilinidion resinicola TaxID=574789 RepID=A0A6A6Y164_9PEZI|nr:AhpC-TSA-domain-containing protein [Mytilinidion resinicola]KAF2801557.1 AhpC-TSA-domain-containing protein [Mytilinidion resinicola]
MSLTEQLSAQFQGFHQNAPPQFKGPILAAMDEHKSSFKPGAALQIGQAFPDFSLSNAVSEKVSRDDLLAKGPFFITFYRGEWCPFCNLAIGALQAHLDEFTVKGVTLVAVSPELPNGNLSMTEKHDLKFPVLSDQGNQLARKLGIIFAMPDSLRPVFDMTGHNLKKTNGDDSFEVPLPAAFLVDGKGVVRNSYVDPDYTKRIEPTTALGWIDAL